MDEPTIPARLTLAEYDELEVRRANMKRGKALAEWALIKLIEEHGPYTFNLSDVVTDPDNGEMMEVFEDKGVVTVRVVPRAEAEAHFLETIATTPYGGKRPGLMWAASDDEPAEEPAEGTGEAAAAE